MRLLITGALGTVGLVTVREALARGHQVTVLIRRNRRNERTDRRLGRYVAKHSCQDRLRVCWGDIRRRDDVAAAVEGQDAVIHMAAMLPPRCETHPAQCEAVNVGGTRNLIAALEGSTGGRPAGSPAARGNDRPGLVYVSSVSVMGPTQHEDPPRTAGEPPHPTDVYSTSKTAAEALVRDSRLPWAILRLSAVMPTSGFYRVSMARLMFDMALAARCEIVVDLDAAYALVEAAESLYEGGRIRGRTVFIAGGRDKGCQMSIAEMIEGNLDSLGLKLPRPQLFSPDLDGYYLDWYETDEGQRILGYQRHSVEDWKRLSFRRFRILRTLLWPVRLLARLYLECVGRRERASRRQSRRVTDCSDRGSRPTGYTRRTPSRPLP